MSRFKARALVVALAWGVLASVTYGQATSGSVTTTTATPAMATATATDQTVTVTVVSDGAPGANLTVADAPSSGINVAYGSIAIGEYWVGIQCYPVTPALRAQLSLPEKQGLVVGVIVPESPAAKAGIAQHDILMKAGDKSLASPRDLVEAIDATKGKAIKVEIIHAGARKTLEATPAKRPATIAITRAATEQPDRGMMQQLVEGIQFSEAGETQPPMRFRIFHPGAIVPKDVLVKRPFPANLNVVISKDGDQPAKISVKRDKEKWEVTEKELEKLPADVRPHVDQLLGRGVFGIVTATKAVDIMPDVTVMSKIEAADQIPPQFRTPLDARIEKRFDELNQRIDKLFKAMEEWQAGKDQKK